MRMVRWMRWHFPPDTRFEIRVPGVGLLRLITLPLVHGGYPQYWIITSERGRKHFVSLKLEGQGRVETRDLRLSKQAALTTAPVPCAVKWAANRRRSHTLCAADPANTRLSQRWACLRRWPNISTTLSHGRGRTSLRCWHNIGSGSRACVALTTLNSMVIKYIASWEVVEEKDVIQCLVRRAAHKVIIINCHI